MITRPTCLLLGESLPKILFTPYPSAPLQKFSERATCRIARRATRFFLDNGQQQAEKLNELLSTTFAPEYAHVRYVVGYVDESGGGNDRFMGFMAGFARRAIVSE